ncbi:ABC transporter ATP-binding protein [Clostridium sediminicola]|uniref:ABC transporter ATP-binding protein n=1 Tax=Clostridium sediminicola TaxID=3114879 RepID=UPI0031F2037D
MNNDFHKVLSFKDVSKTFINPSIGEKMCTLNSVSLNVRKGEIVGIIGPSGCGKSTLLNIVAGFEKADSGTVIYKNQSIQESLFDSMGMVFQSPSLFPWLNVKKNIEYGLKIKKVSKEVRQKKVEEYINRVDLKEFKYYFPHQLSGGMQQRVALARALVMKPSLLLMDEPFAALDYQTRLEMQSLLMDLWEIYKPTILFVTHDIDEALILSDRIVVMSKRPAKIIQEVIVPFERPRSLFSIENSKFSELKTEIYSLLMSNIK